MDALFNILQRTLNKLDDISLLFSEYREFYGIKVLRIVNLNQKNSLKKD